MYGYAPTLNGRRFPSIGVALPTPAVAPALQQKALMLASPFADTTVDPSEQVFNNGFNTGASSAATRGILAGAVGTLLVCWLAKKL